MVRMHPMPIKLTFFALNRDNLIVANRHIRAKFGTYADYRVIEPQQWSKRIIDELPPRPIFGGRSKVFFRINRDNSAAICPILLKFSICVEYGVAETAQ